MTCIVGLLDGKDVWMGADSARSWGNRVQPCREPKVFRRGEFMIGLTGSPRAAQLLRYSFTAPDHPSRMSVGEFMRTRFVDSVRKCLKAGGYAEKEDEKESIGSSVMIGYRGSLWYLDYDYQISGYKSRYLAMGSGVEYALGSLATSKGLVPEPKRRLLLALKVAAAFCPTVASPFVVRRLT